MHPYQGDTTMNPFVEYVYSFYGPNQIYGHFFDHKLTKSAVIAAANLLITHPSNDFHGDSFDREKCRDILFWMFGAPSKAEYNVSIFFPT